MSIASLGPISDAISALGEARRGGASRQPHTTTTTSSLRNPSQAEIISSHLDITGIQHGLEIEIRDDGAAGIAVVWVNLDGVCLLRICQIKPHQLIVSDHRSHQP